MPLAPVLRGHSIRARPDIVLGEKESNCEIHLDNADNETLKVIVEYAYEGKITGLNSENVAKVERVADMYNIMGILNECRKLRDKSKEAPTF